VILRQLDALFVQLDTICSKKFVINATKHVQAASLKITVSAVSVDIISKDSGVDTATA
jgi:hypothetical protein